MAPLPSLMHSLTQPLAERGVRGELATSNIFATRPMKVTALGPAIRSLISMSVYSNSSMISMRCADLDVHYSVTPGCQMSAGFGFKAFCNSSAVNPSPTGTSLASDLTGDVTGVRYACMEAFAFFLCLPMLIK